MFIVKMGIQSEHSGTCMATSDIRDKKEMPIAITNSSYSTPLTYAQRKAETKHLDKKRMPLTLRPGSDTLYILENKNTEMPTCIPNMQPGIFTYSSSYSFLHNGSTGKCGSSLQEPQPLFEPGSWVKKEPKPTLKHTVRNKQRHACSIKQSQMVN